MPDIEKLSDAEAKFFSSKGEDAPAPETPAVAAPPEGEKQPDAKIEQAKDGDADPGKDSKGGSVPQQALHEERERRKAAQKERDEIKTNFTRLQSRLDTLTEIAKSAAAPPKAETAPQIPDIDTDPVGHFRAKTAALEAELAETRKWREGQEQQSQAFNNVQRIAQLAQGHEAEFKKTTPDYDAASTHLRSIRDAQLIAYGVENPLERQNIIAQDAITIAANALSQGKNPAQIIYDMAKASGFTGTKPGNGAAAAVETRPANGAPTEAEKIAMAAAGQKAGGSLGQMNGAANPPTTIQKILDMSDDEFAAATKGDNWRKVVEGSSR